MSARIAVIPGDGVGQEVVPEGVRVLSAIDPGIEFVELDWGSARWERTGAMMPADGLARLRELRRDLPRRDRLADACPTTSRCGGC